MRRAPGGARGATARRDGEGEAKQRYKKEEQQPHATEALFGKP